MYDDEEEIKRKRRNLIIAIAVVVVLIIILILILFMKGKSTKPKKTNVKCSLVLSEKYDKNSDGEYTEPIVVGVKVEPKDETVTSKQVYTADTPSRLRKETYTVNKNGKTTLQGKVTTKDGTEIDCGKLEVTLKLTKPSCELEVKEGKLGTNNWYNSDVVIGFKSKDSNNKDTKIVKYYLESAKTTLDDGEIVRENPPKENMDSITIKENQITEVIGYVEDSSGDTGSCKIVVSKDSEKPKCSLKVTSGSANSNGVYSGNVTVGFNAATDETSAIAEKGIGTSKNYKDQSYTLPASQGTTTIYGYVKDTAGNESTCQITIKKPTTTPPDNPKTSNPSCSLSVNGANVTMSYSTTNGASITSYGLGTTKGQYNSQKTYTATSSGTVYGSVKDSYGHTATCSVNVVVSKESKPSCSMSIASNGIVTLKYATTNGATITNYGMGKTVAEAEKYNMKNTFQAVVGDSTIYGAVKDSYGNKAECIKNIKASPTLASKVSVGDKVAYNAGTWTTTAPVPTSDGTFGGYSANSSKNNGVMCSSSDRDKGTANGWSVLSVNNGVVTIIHNGTPECYYHALKSNATNAINSINSEVRSKFLNTSLATDARAASCNDLFGNSTCSGNMSNFVRINSGYFFTSKKSDNATLYSYLATQRITGQSGHSNGIRPIVVLKASVITSGKNSNGEWILGSTRDFVADESNNFENTNIIQSVLNSIKNTLQK